MAHSKMLHEHGEPTKQNSMCGGENLDCSVDSVQFLAFTR